MRVIILTRREYFGSGTRNAGRGETKMRRRFISLVPGIFFLFAFALLVDSRTHAQSGKPVPGSGTSIETASSPATCDTLTNYRVQRAYSAWEPATELVLGSQCDFCRVPITIPFPVRLYERVFTNAIATDNGTLQFASSELMLENNFYLLSFMYRFAIHGYWDDLDMRPTTCPECGIYTELSGLSPNRTFDVRWQACRYQAGSCGEVVEFQIRFYEETGRFDIVYGEVSDKGSSATIGVERDVEHDTPNYAQGLYTQVSYNEPSLQLRLTYQFWQDGCDLVPPPCPGEKFSDVCQEDYFYASVLSLNEAGVVSGYGSSPPCENEGHVPCFKPYEKISRGQASKVVALAAGLQGDVSGQTFEDVPPGSTFYEYIMQLVSRGVIGGYDCGTIAAEPCGPEKRPYFRPGAPVSRGQLSKIISNTARFTEYYSTSSFQDVPLDHPFYIWIERLVRRNIVSGYACGSPAEPCENGSLPYFRPGAEITRGQTAKVVYLVWLQEKAKE